MIVPDFVCRIADSNGKTTNATYNSVSELELRQRLEGQGFLVYSIKEKAKKCKAFSYTWQNLIVTQVRKLLYI